MRRSLWKRAQSCSEVGLRAIAQDWALQIRPGDRILLNGPMGAGKSTLARFLLEAVGTHLPPEGSPSFAVAHEYPSRLGKIVHIDVYRLEEESELESTGVDAALWEATDSVVLIEWMSKFPENEKTLLARYRSGRVWSADLQFSTGEDARRDLTVDVSAPAS